MEKSPIISLDIETSSDEQRGNIVSIGLVDYQTKLFLYFMVNHSQGLFVKPAAFVVNGIDVKDLGNPRNLTLEDLDRELCRWVPQDAVMMGRGISYFDALYVGKDLPQTLKRFNRRLFDLYGFMYGISEKKNIELERVRELAFSYADEQCAKKFTAIGLHHALYDAWHNCYMLDFLKTL